MGRTESVAELLVNSSYKGTEITFTLSGQDSSSSSSQRVYLIINPTTS